MSDKYVYFFSKERTEGDQSMKKSLGGKGAGLAEMAKLKIPIPPGFTIVIEVCPLFYQNNEQIPKNVEAQVWEHLAALEKASGRGFGNAENPLLLSVRSGAEVSMPGMMDTILNLGLTEQTLQGIIKQTKNERFALDSYRRFISMFGATALGVKGELFIEAMDHLKKSKGVKLDIELGVNELKQLITTFKAIFKKETGREFPQCVKEQLLLAVRAVFKSWNSDRAIYYRQMNHLTGYKGTAVNVQQMVFGNMGNQSGSGVAFSRSSTTGENQIEGEFLINAQGEDVVAGIRTPSQIADLEKDLPACYKEFLGYAKQLERHFKDMQDLEFTIEEGKLYMLQTRNGKRTAQSALKIAVDLVTEGLITKEVAIQKVEANSLNQLLHPFVPPNVIAAAKKNKQHLGTGINASPGAAEGVIAFNTKDAIEITKTGKKVILVRQETSPEDIQGMNISAGILTARGGKTSHAAVVARGMGKSCVSGWTDIVEFSEHKKYFKITDGRVFKEGDHLTIIGDTGDVFAGKLEMKKPDFAGEYFTKLLTWSDEIAKLKVRTNADTPEDAKTALSFGAQGIGLCRTEHMFFKKERIIVMRQMILAKDEAEQKKYLDQLEVFQRQDFEGLFSAMKGKPVTIRMLDPPLHEFLPEEKPDIEYLAKLKGVSPDVIHRRVHELKETNPMLGNRGCRLGITLPNITIMQARAIFEAAAKVDGAIPEIMVPLIGFDEELKHQKKIIEEQHKLAEQKFKKKINYLFGTMIEVPRGAIVADTLVKSGAQFFSFGTNDLTQMTCGLSRDDAGKFLPQYKELKIVPRDPFEVIDRQGVGFLMQQAVSLGRKEDSKLKLGICGEHGGEPNSIEFCHLLGLDYVSCSPYRVPIARLAAAQSALKFKHGSVTLATQPSAKL